VTNQGESDGLFAEKQGEVLQFLLPNGGTPMSIIASPKISAFPMRRGELPVGSGKFLKNGLILVGSGRVC
jgi:hypothetical protein